MNIACGRRKPAIVQASFGYSIAARRVRATALAMVAALAVLLTSAGALALNTGSRAWVELSKVLPGNAGLVVFGGAAMTSVRQSTTYSQFVPGLINGDPDVKTWLGDIRTGCPDIGDPMTAIDSVAFAATDPDATGGPKGAVAVAFGAGVTEQKVSKCIANLARAKGKRISASKNPGDGIIELVYATNQKVYFKFVTPDVAVLATKPDDRALLASMLGGGFAASSSAVLVAKAPTDAALWMACDKAQNIAPNVTMKAAYAWANVASGMLSVELHVVAPTPAQVPQQTTFFANAVQQMKPSLAKVPDLTNATKNLAIGSSGDETVLKTKLPEIDLVSIITEAMHGQF